MGYHLWTSPVTGYRRRGTRAAEFRELFERGVTVAAVREPLRCCRTDDPAHLIAEEMARLDFDVIGVGEPDTGRAVGWLRTDDVANGGEMATVRPIEPHQLVSDATPLVDLLRILADEPWVFVVSGRGVTGIVTRADLQKPPLRALLFGLLSLLEMHLTFWVNLHYPEESWRHELKKPRLEKAEALLAKRKERNEEIGLLDCLQLCDKRDLIVTSEQVRAALDLGSKNAATAFLRDAEKLRDRVAHSQLDLVAGSSWKDVANTVSGVVGLLDSSDNLIEQIAEGGEEPQFAIAF